MLKTLLPAKPDTVESHDPVWHALTPGELETLPKIKSFKAQLFPPLLLESMQALSA